MPTPASSLRLRSFNSPQVLEGGDLLFDLAFVAAANVDTALNLAFSGVAERGVDYRRSYQASFDCGVSFNSYSGEALIVPAGASNVLFRVASIDDQSFEKSERVTITATANEDTLSGSGLIVNDDKPALTVVSVTGDEKVEGNNLVFTVQLDGNIADTQFPPGSVCPTAAWSCTQQAGKGTIDLGGYAITLEEYNSIWVLTNKATGAETRIWGDPHVDLGNNGSTEFDFKKSMSFQLSDGTKITVDTVAWGNSGETLSSKLTITDWCGSKAMVVTGLGWDSDGSGNLDVQKLDGQGKALDLATSDGAFTLYENPNGNWNIFDGRAANQNLINDLESGKLVDCGSTVSLSLAAGTATQSQDFLVPIEVSMDNGVTWALANEGSVRVPTGIDTFLARVSTADDVIVEVAENLTLSAMSGTSSASALGNILDNDAVLATVTCVSSVVANEGEPLQFEISLSGSSTVSTNVTLGLNDGTATGGIDFARTGVQVSFNNGLTWEALSDNIICVPACIQTLFVRVAGVDDTVFEGSAEVFTLSAQANGVGALGIGTICENDDAPKVLSIGNSTVSEGDALSFHVELTGTATSDTLVSLAVTNSTADGSDFTDRLEVSFDGGLSFVNTIGTSVTVPAGKNTFEVRIASNEDTAVEGNETFTLQASANGGSATGIGTILNDDVAPPLPPVVEAKVLGVSCASANEGDPLQFEVTLDGAPAVTNVTLSLKSGTATADTDFATTPVQLSFDNGQTWAALTSNTVSVPAGSTSLLVKVQSAEDAIYEGNSETFSLTAATKTSSASGVGSILNDDEPILGISSVTGGGAIEGSFLQFDIGLHGTVAYPNTPPGSTCPPEDWSFNQAGSRATINLGNYSIQLQEKLASWTLINNETGECTRIWGDPHVDVDNDGQIDFDFKENITFQLNDGTKITVDTIEWEKSDRTLCSKLTITDWAGQNAMVVTGLGWYSDGVANLKVEEFEGQGQSLDLETNDGSLTLYENLSGGWKIFDGRGATQTLVNQLENGLLVDPGSTITLALSQGTANLGADYLDKLEVSMDGGNTWIPTDAGTVRIPVGVDTLLARTPTVDDSTGEPLEQVRLTATASTTSVGADGTIFDNDAMVSSYSVSLTQAPEVDSWVTVEVGGVTDAGVTLFNSDGQSVYGTEVKVFVQAGATESQPFLLQNPAKADGGTHLPLNLTITDFEPAGATLAGTVNGDAPSLRDILIDTGDGEIDLATLGVQADPRLTAVILAGSESKLTAADIQGGALDIEHLLSKPAAATEN
jgi:hypothetical protein